MIFINEESGAASATPLPTEKGDKEGTKKKVGDALSVAYGYACYDGGKKSSVLNAYEQADEEMYACKRLIKSRAVLV